MKILHIYTGNLYGGLESMLSTISRYSSSLANVSNEFALCFEGRLSAELSASGCNVHQLGSPRMSRPWTVWKARIKLHELMQCQRYDVAICHSPWPYAVFSKTVAKFNCLNVFWTHQFLDGNGVDQRLSRKKVPDLVICNSHFTKSSVRTLFAEVKSEVVYCPHSIRIDGERANANRKIREETSTKADSIVVLQASRMECWKGQRLLLKALAEIGRKYSWVLWLAGGAQRENEKAYAKELKSLAAELGIQEQVRFLGQRQDVPELLAACDIVCQPNESPEHFGLFYIEGLAAGKPVVASDMGGASEILTKDCGILCEPNPQSLSVSLESLMASPERRQRLGMHGPARAAFLCDPVSRLQQLYDILEVTKRT
jgi:glycosyltransferase involved in cell wall biosynthesis